MKEKLKQAIARHIAADTTRKSGGTKGAITRLANERASEIGVKAARAEILEVLNEFTELPSWIIFRYYEGYIYVEGSRVMGWWQDYAEQLQAEELPLAITSDGTFVSFFGFEKVRSLWEQRGFLEAQSLILQPESWRREGSQVKFPVKDTLEMLQYKYALPCPL